MKVLVTGGWGFIGKHLVRKLVSLGYSVSVIDNDPRAPDYIYGAVDYYNLDICNFDDIKDLFNVDYVFHLAAEARIQHSIDNPRFTTNVNVMGTVNVLDACVAAGVKKFIYSSTSAVYGLAAEFPTGEDANIDCLNPYSASKFASEEMVKCYTRLYGLDSCIFRYFNVYNDDSPLVGPYSLVIGRFLNQFKNGESLTVVGTGDSLRDFIHVDDVVRINVLAAEHNSSLGGEVFNVGSGVNISILDVAKLISDNIVFVEPRVGEAKTTLAKIEKATRFFGWTPSVSLEEWIKGKL